MKLKILKMIKKEKNLKMKLMIKKSNNNIYIHA